jgi:DNA-binding transcriptional regulator YiaG
MQLTAGEALVRQRTAAREVPPLTLPTLKKESIGMKKRKDGYKLPIIATAEVFTNIRETLGLKISQLATMFDTSIRTIERYEKGSVPVPVLLSKLMFKMSASPHFLAEMLKDKQTIIVTTHVPG